MINKGLLILGIACAVVAALGMFFVGQLLNPSPSIIVVAQSDIEPGTKLADLPDGSLTKKQLRGDSDLLGRYLTVDQFGQLASKGGVFVTRVAAGEAIPITAVLSSDNPAANKYTALILEDPNMTAMTIDAKDVAPNGIRAGDQVDIILAVDNIREQTNQDLAAQQPTYEFTVPTEVGTPSADGSSDSGQAATQVPHAAVQTPTAALTPTESYIPPLAKRIVNNAYVLNVIRDQRNSTGVDGNNTIVYGAITGLTVMIPRVDTEWVAMGNAAGNLKIALLSPISDESKKPSTGVSVQDLMHLYYSDRETLAPTLNPVTSTPEAAAVKASAKAPAQAPTQAQDPAPTEAPASAVEPTATPAS